MIRKAKKLSYADYEKIPPDLHRHEIIEGEEFMTPAPSPEHQTVVGSVFAVVRAHVTARKLGRVFVAPTDVKFSEHDVVQPDVLFIAAKRASIITEKNIQGAPDLVIEVASPSTAFLDRGHKLALYERCGVREYWIVEPAGRTVEIHEFGSPRRTRIYKEGQAFDSALLPGLTVKVGELFA
ncbi:MAG: Uma2 family endonuclease [Planctomycetes bacterium]|nr:Uma2 family endonuclease [Planctomycetota bacterium]